MLIVLSPAKTLDYATPQVSDTSTVVEFSSRSAALITLLRQYSAHDLATLMGISPALAELNKLRYRAWRKAATHKNARAALLAFNGDVYQGLDAPSLGVTERAYLQTHLRILSGLYGALRPLDLMQPYRLEMGTRLPNARGDDLYAFWGDSVTDALNRVAAEQHADALVNLASEEYFRVVRPARLQVPVITPVFQDWKNGHYKVISFYAKRARGLMTRFAACHRIAAVDGLRDFDLDGYSFAPAVSDERHWIFRRRIGD